MTTQRHMVKAFEARYEKRTEGESTKEVWLTFDQLEDVYNNKVVATAIRKFCQAEEGRVQEHPQAPRCIQAMQYHQGLIISVFRSTQFVCFGT